MYDALLCIINFKWIHKILCYKKYQIEFPFFSNARALQKPCCKKNQTQQHNRHKRMQISHKVKIILQKLDFAEILLGLVAR